MTDPDHRRRVISTSAGIIVGGIVHLLTLFNFSADLGRTATSGFFSGVYEVQARAFLDGRIAVPDGSMAIEGFIRGDDTYMYFPPWPALLRMPVLMTTREFDGRLTLLSMGLAWIVFVVCAVKLVWWLHARLTDRTTVSRGEAVLVAIFLAATGGGTFMTYDASLPWVYHEVYAWAIAASLGALYWLLRVLTAPDWHAVRWLGAFCFVAIATRATSGWALCLTVVAVGLWFAVRRSTPERRMLWWGILLAGAIPLGLSIAYNLHKFDHVYMFPLQDQVWTQVNAHRREALAANGGAITGLQFFPTAFHAYLWPTGIRFVDYFPWITLPARPPEALAGAFVDQAYRTASATAFMPLFMLLQVISTVVVFGPWAPSRARVLRVPMISAVLITGGVMAYGYFAARYASEFVPALVLGGAVGTVLAARALRGRRVLVLVAGERPSWRRSRSSLSCPSASAWLPSRRAGPSSSATSAGSRTCPPAPRRVWSPSRTPSTTGRPTSSASRATAMRSTSTPVTPTSPGRPSSRAARPPGSARTAVSGPVACPCSGSPAPRTPLSSRSPTIVSCGSS